MLAPLTLTQRVAVQLILYSMPRRARDWPCDLCDSREGSDAGSSMPSLIPFLQVGSGCMIHTVDLGPDMSQMMGYTRDISPYFSIRPGASMCHGDSYTKLPVVPYQLEEGGLHRNSEIQKTKAVPPPKISSPISFTPPSRSVPVIAQIRAQRCAAISPKSVGDGDGARSGGGAINTRDINKT